eukprot:CAMPEP_0172548336 /NCGR_PEP_ID=MMETSP1067-20121228/17650_1 /TAXON_ID=265564 ORGANISM="Thalassiosira punctigera, Strain Tpunct2005C2" /NCGR_SAMPLE_ID=MMETSP1067 /ASSEMBLY_ACC=CAM_ASM_000444 /LENGTH=116 /DNA_ID=CAMNT_0013335539 /DNA_START=37 /DNA_END=384 /DNA_ORIENTATION=+
MTHHRHTIILLCSIGNDSPSGDAAGGGDDNDENESLLDELRNTKKDMFGADIPINDELQDAAKNAENAFLAAMLEQTRQFQEIKSKEGSKKAVDIFMGRIQEVDEASRMYQRTEEE